MEEGKQEVIYLHHIYASLNYCCVAGTLGAAAAAVVNDVEVVEGGADCVGAAVEVAAGTVQPSPEVVAVVEEKVRHRDGVPQLHTYLS
jgi:hypothetical protein